MPDFVLLCALGYLALGAVFVVWLLLIIKKDPHQWRKEPVYRLPLALVLIGAWLVWPFYLICVLLALWITCTVTRDVPG